MEEIRENKMGNTPMLRLIISMSLPAIFSMLVQSLYNIVDSYFVANMAENGEIAVNALTLAFPVIIWRRRACSSRYETFSRRAAAKTAM